MLINSVNNDGYIGIVKEYYMCSIYQNDKENTRNIGWFVSWL